MKPICILTDNTAQFPKPTSNEQSIIEVIKLKSVLRGVPYSGENDKKIEHLPKTADDKLRPQLLAPSPEEIAKVFLKLGQQYEKILGIFISGQLNSLIENSLAAAKQVKGKVSIEVIDSQTTSIGLGYLVQLAVSAAQNSTPASEIERLIRTTIPFVYTIFCIPDLSYLYYGGFVDRTQSIISSMLGLYPIFTLENGKLIPLEKVRNLRHTAGYLQEFLDEFDNVQIVAFQQSVPPVIQEARFLRDHIQENHPKTFFNEYYSTLPLATLFGPLTFGVFIIETSNPKTIK